MNRSPQVAQSHLSTAAVAGLCLLLSACDGSMSTLAPAGQAAADIAWISWVMIFGTLFFMLLMSVLWLQAVYRPSERTRTLDSRTVLIWGGLAMPLAVITLLLIYGVRSGHSMLPIGQPDGEVRVTAYQWFWEFEYDTDDGETFTLIDELHLPVGQRIDVHVGTNDVIHSFWVPALAGKIDAIPGRINTIRLHPTRIGEFRGQCAEFCGVLHAHMAFEVTVHTAESYRAWLQAMQTQADTEADS
ncbi:MAG: cytochrome c oxidase subunit II [Wenzhouxiangella sp.]